jgi:hypothetical protein
MPKGKEQVDHHKRSVEWLEQAEARSLDAGAERDLRFAEVHAQLANAQQLERLNETLEAISEPSAGQFDGALRVRNA